MSPAWTPRAWLQRLQAPSRWRLSTRIVLLSLALLLLVQVAGFAVIRGAIDSNARRTLQAELAVAERVWRRLVEQRSTKLTQAAAVLAADYGFRSAVATGDRETVDSALENHGQRIQASVVALLDPQFELRAHSGTSEPGWLPVLAQATAQVAATGSAVVMLEGRPVQLVAVPLKAPVVMAWVVMGFELDTRLLEELRDTTQANATLLVAEGGVQRALASSLPLSMQPTAWVAPPADTDTLQLGDGQHLLRRAVVAGTGGRAAELWLTGSLAQALEPYEALQLTLLSITALGLLLFGLGSVWAAQRVTQPLATLVAASERLGRGDLDTPLADIARGDEVGELSKAFEQMRRNIAQQQAEVRRLAFWDELTGLPNRAQFREALQAGLRSGEPQSVLMLDIDRFKHVNDVLGYAFGDRLLQAVAERLQGVVREGDLVARLGGDEFALLLPGAGPGQAGAMAQRIAGAFEQPLVLDDQVVDLSAGVGMACAPEHAAEADLLLSRAEVAMFAAKQRTAGAQLYAPQLDSGSAQTLSLLSELRHAVEAGELRLFLQPKVGVDHGRLIGAEALVRWQHPLRGLVPPMQFIPFAEQTGFVRQLTLWVIEEAARQWRELRQLGLRRVSVNLSTRDLMDLELPEKLDAILARHGTSPQAFCLEITESAIMDDPQRARGTLDRLAERGFKLSIDDFGTGYSSLAYLKQLPVQELKIDKGFVMGMVDDAGDEMIVRSTIDLAHNLGLSVVAEGVETAAVLDRLGVLGCDEAQGYHIAKPMPLPAFLEWARARQPESVTQF
jgi:diguanylate cyclase (GGDEF)-like protein